jgi:hypothetical protein
VGKLRAAGLPGAGGRRRGNTVLPQ